MSNPAFNNIHNGVLISTDRMKDISWAENDTILRVSAGALWSEVYAKAEEYGKVVVGGRVGDVGVSGFLLGGGMSHLGAEHGFGSDNVAGMQVCEKRLRFSIT
jgi:FAD/FMN-containing dehydrogenase